MRAPALVAPLTLLLAGCVYYNGLWNAHRYTRQAQREERSGEAEAALQTWGLAAVEAESVSVHHPHSGWLPDALVTEGEGRAGSGECDGALVVLDSAAAITSNRALDERIALARARCALRAGDYGAAGSYAGTALDSKDRERRDLAALLAGRAARAAGAWDSAVALYTRSPERAAGVELVLSLVSAGRERRADSLCDSILRRRPLEGDWDSIFAAMAATAGPVATSATVGRIVPRARLTQGARARLYLDDGYRLLSAGDPDGADARFVLAQHAAADSAEGDLARIARLRARVARAPGLDSVAAVSVALHPLTQHGSAVDQARRLQQTLAQLSQGDSTVVAAFRGGELARDSLVSPPLAAALLLGFAERNPTSLFAPKAILAAMPLDPGRRDSLAGVLDGRYATSPYTMALRGLPSPGYAAAEDSLARLFGLRTASAAASLAARDAAAPLIPVPRTGWRGPLLDEAVAPVMAAPTIRRGQPTRPGAPRRPGAPTDTIM